ncbi:MAG: carbohydrate ABC transporter permease, partial [Candidatus Limnocylindrales bacterium]
MSRQTRRNLVVGLLFISPWLVGFLAFYLYPALASLYYSFTDFRILAAPHWIGLANYQQMLADPLFWKSLGNTFYLT